jgi:hypothetical protein
MQPAGTVERIQRLLADCQLQDPLRFVRTPLPCPIAFNTQIDEFILALSDAAGGERAKARASVQTINHEPVVKWYDETAQHVGAERAKFLGRKPERRGGGGKRDMRLPRVRRIAQRDGYLCGYCDVRLIEPEVLRKIDKMLGGGVLHKRSTPRNNRSYHGVWLMMALTLDHIEPLALNHDDSDDNLVASCWACNFGKYHFTLEELNLDSPKTKRGEQTGWYGARDLIG